MSYSNYSPEFRAEAVRMVIEFSRPIIDVASELRINSETLRVWVNKTKRAGVQKSDSFADIDAKELGRLHRQIADLEQENAFLKKAAAFVCHEHVVRLV
jgi:transposase